MITTILEKCLAELNSDAIRADGAGPRLDYVRGMLEVLLATQEKPKSEIISVENPQRIISGSTPGISATDEASILDAKARAAIETVKALAGKPE